MNAASARQAPPGLHRRAVSLAQFSAAWMTIEAAGPGVYLLTRTGDLPRRYYGR
jgi:hypothetical protein